MLDATAGSLSDANIRQQRAFAVDEFIALAKSFKSKEKLHSTDLQRASDALAQLAARKELFPFAHFPVDINRINAFYRLSEDADGGYALFISASIPGRKQAPHDHTTWAIIAGVLGTERNVVYQRSLTEIPDHDKLTKLQEVEVGAGDVITLNEEQVHTTEIIGNEPSLHLHFYGLTQERMFKRVKYESPEGGAAIPVPVPTQIRHALIDAATLHARLHRKEELAVLDVRDEGLFADQGHLLAATIAPLDSLEVIVDALLRRNHVPIVLVDRNEELAHLAAAKLFRLGYKDISVLRGGTDAWLEAGYEVFYGVHVIGKALAEQAYISLQIPDITVSQFEAWQSEKRPLLLLDVRPFEEYHRYTIPGSINCPLADLVVRVPALDLPAETIVIVHCAGRARSLIGAQALIAAGLTNPIYALRNGTIDWELSGHFLTKGATAALPEPQDPPASGSVARAYNIAMRAGVSRIDSNGLDELLNEREIRSVYLFDIRSPEEFEAGHLTGWSNAPGGQLLHSLDSFLPTRDANIILVDWDEVQAPYIAAWLSSFSQFNVFLLTPSSDVPLETGPAPRIVRQACEIHAPRVSPATLIELLSKGAILFDIEDSRSYVAHHIEGAQFATPRWIIDWISREPPSAPIILTSRDGILSQSVAAEFRRRTGYDIRSLRGGNKFWRESGLALVAGSGTVRTTEDQWKGPHSVETAGERRQAFNSYLAWEAGLLSQLRRDGTEFNTGLFSSCLIELGRASRSKTVQRPNP